MAALEEAVALDAADTELRVQLAALLEAADEPARALAEYARVAEQDPEAHQVCNRMGLLLQRFGRTADALKAFCEALRLHPTSAEYCFNAGSACQALADWEQAAGFFQRSLELAPDAPAVLNHLGTCLFSLGRYEEALAPLRRSLALRPDSPEALTNLGEVLRRLNRLEESAEAQLRAVALAPADPSAHANLGNTRLSQNRPAEALSCYERAGDLSPRTAGFAYNSALARLALGDWENGWSLFEARLEKDDRWRSLRSRFWDGRAPSKRGERLLVIAEQGLGDTLQFVRYARAASALGFRVSLLAHAALQPLFAVQPWLASVHVEGERLPEFDLCCPLLSLPRLLWKNLPRVPGETPYLSVPEERAAYAADLLGASPTPRVGLVWSGHPGQANNRNRSLSLDLLARAFPERGVSFFALQKLLRPEDREALARHPEITDLSSFLRDFADTAAVVRGLDLVVSVDTSMAHLAGALGAPEFVLLCFSPDWRWQPVGAPNLWYPRARLARQVVPGDWTPVLAELAQALDALKRGGV